MFRRYCAAFTCAAALWSAAAAAPTDQAAWHVGEATRVFHPAAARH